MTISGSPEIFRQEMPGLMQGLDFIWVYIDDLLCISNTIFNDHLDKVRLVSTRLREAGLKVNAEKSFFCSTSCKYLRYVLSQDDIRPQDKKVETILALKPPTNVKTLRGFLGIVQYYRDIWEKRSDMLAPLMSRTGRNFPFFFSSLC